MKNKKKKYFLFGPLLPYLIPLVAFSCKHDLHPENDTCLKGRIIGNGCNIEGYLIELVDYYNTDIEVGSVTIGDQKYDDVIMTFSLSPYEHWKIEDEISFNLGDVPVEEDSHLCQDLYATAPAYNLVEISKLECL